MQVATRILPLIAAACLAGASSCDDDDGAWGQAEGVVNGEPWEGRAYFIQGDTCRGLELVVEGPYPGYSPTVDLRFFVPGRTAFTTPVVDVRIVEDYLQQRCLRRDDTTLVRIFTGGADFIDERYASTPIAGALRELVIDDVSEGGDQVSGSFSLSARLWSDGEPPVATPNKPDTLLFEDVTFTAPLLD